MPAQDSRGRLSYILSGRGGGAGGLEVKQRKGDAPVHLVRQLGLLAAQVVNQGPPPVQSLPDLPPIGTLPGATAR